MSMTILPRALIQNATMAAAVLLVTGCNAANNDDATNAAATNETVVIKDPVHDTAMTGTDDIAVYSEEEMRRYMAGDDRLPRHFELDRVTFASGSATLDTAARAQIAGVAAVMKDFPQAAITVSAFADPEGSTDANNKLSADRALAVQQALQAGGIPDTAIHTMIGGEVGTSVTRDKRRVEFMVERR